MLIGLILICQKTTDLAFSIKVNRYIRLYAIERNVQLWNKFSKTFYRI